MDRKQFLITSTLSTFSLTTLGCVVPRDQNENGSTHKGDCTTTDDILGPFYRANAPTRSNMLDKSAEGNKVQIRGVVYSDDCTTAIKDVLVEIWHCNINGEYDNESSEYHHRAKQLTNESGEYSFTTILPGKYLNGRLYRPAHIHFRITHKNHQELISQIYFVGDPNITQDPWASSAKAQQRILPIVLGDTNGNLEVVFDIYLDKK